VSGDNRLSFFNLAGFVKALKAEYPPADWQRLHDDAVRLPASG